MVIVILTSRIVISYKTQKAKEHISPHLHHTPLMLEGLWTVLSAFHGVAL